MKFIVLGAGAMGSLYGARLKKAKQDVVFIDAVESVIQAINERGLCVDLGDGEEYLDIPAYLAKDYQEKADAIIVFTKGIHTESALKSIAHIIDKNTLLISFQNGVGHDRIMETYSDQDHIIIGTTNFPSDRVADGKIISKGAGVTRMMTISKKETEALQDLHGIFKQAGLNPEIQPDIFSAIWEKVAFNAALNSLTSVLLMPQGYMGETKEGKELAHAIVDETCMVAIQKGIPVATSHVHQNVDHLLEEHFLHCPSMLQDVLAERITEIDFINGAVVREAEDLRLEVPVTKTLYYLVSIIQRNYSHRLIIKK